MSGVWLQISGLPPRTTPAEVAKLTRNRAIAIETQDVSAFEAAGRFLVDDMKTAKDILQRANYEMYRGSLVKINLGLDDLSQYPLVTVNNFQSQAVTEKRLYQHCGSCGGDVCNIEITGPVAKVWFFDSTNAQSFVASLGSSGLCAGEPVVQLKSCSSLATSVSPVDVIALDSDSDRNMAVDTPLSRRLPEAPSPRHNHAAKHNVPRQTNGLPAGRQPVGQPSANAPNAGRFKARKSLGRNMILRNRRTSDAYNGHGLDTAKPDKVALATSGPAGSDASLPARGLSDQPLAVPDMSPDVDNWKARAPYIYEYIYCQNASTITNGGDPSMDCLLSVAWSKTRGSQAVSFYSILGNDKAARTAATWSALHETNGRESSIYTKSQFVLPPRGSLTNSASTLAAFSGRPTGVVHSNYDKFDIPFAATSLKMHDDGHVLFGCAMQCVQVYDTETLGHKGTLLLLNEIDGVYDVGSAHVVANSTKGEVGVWKAGSRNYMWRYNDTRIFKNHSELPVSITALRVATNDLGVYVGDSEQSLAFSDFRERYIQRLGSSHSGMISSIECAGDNKLLVGTYSGDLRLLDTRFLGNAITSTVRTYGDGHRNQCISAIKRCPQNVNMFACSVGKEVLIYYQELPAGQQMLLFNHQAHKTPVTGFCWHPSRNHMYTIASVDQGEERYPGELHIWRPSDLVRYGCGS